MGGFGAEVGIGGEAVEFSGFGEELGVGDADYFGPLEEVEADLRHVGGDGLEAGGFAADGIGGFGVGEIVVESSPEGDGAAGGGAEGGEAFGIEIPGLGLGAEELEGADAIVDDVLDGGGGKEPVVDGGDGDPSGEERSEQRGTAKGGFIAAVEVARRGRG